MSGSAFPKRFGRRFEYNPKRFGCQLVDINDNPTSISVGSHTNSAAQPAYQSHFPLEPGILPFAVGK